MAKSKLVKANEKIAENVMAGYKTIENGVVNGYKKMEKGVSMDLTISVINLLTSSLPEKASLLRKQRFV